MSRSFLWDVGAPVPLTGRYRVQGAMMRAGLELWARHRGARLVIGDDGSDPGSACRVHERLVARGCRFVLGPYGSDSTRAVARLRAGRVVWNQSGAADDVQRLPGVISVPSPASRYLVALGRAVAQLRPGARVMVAIGPGRFARQAAATFRHEATALGLVLVDGGDRADAVLACGSVEWEISLFRKFRARELLRGGLSPGLTAFPSLLRGDSEGYLAPVQWHPDVRVEPQLGPPSVQLEDYVAAQAYAACLIAEHCLELEPDDPYAAGRRLRTTTFFGPFELAEDGLQIGHRLSVVRWSGNRRQLLAADVL